jgi:hypothetical protein
VLTGAVAGLTVAVGAAVLAGVTTVVGATVVVVTMVVVVADVVIAAAVAVVAAAVVAVAVVVAVARRRGGEPLLPIATATPAIPSTTTATISVASWRRLTRHDRSRDPGV